MNSKPGPQYPGTFVLALGAVLLFGSRMTSAQGQQFQAARDALRQGNLEGALEAVRAGLRAAPRSEEGLNLLGMISVRRQEFAEAAQAFETALKVNPHSVETHNNLGNTYFAEKKLDLAGEQYQATLRIQPSNRDANYNLGLVLLAKGDGAGAVTHLRNVKPADAAVTFNLIQAYLESGQSGKALELANSLSAASKGDVRTHFTLGVLLASHKQYGQAAREFELADALEPGSFEILHDLGQAYLRGQNYPKAEATLERALGLQPDSASTLYLLAQVHADQHQDLQALELLVKARKLAPQNTDIIFLMGRLSMTQSFYEDAISVLEEGVKIAPTRPDLRAALGESYFTAGKVDKAIAQFETLIRLDPSAASYAFMGLCYRHLGRFGEALKYFNEGLKKDPRNAACLFNLGYIEHKQGNHAAAEKWLERAVQSDPNYEDALYELAGVKMAQKQYAEALPLLRRSVKGNRNPAEVYYKLATAERNLHQMEAAERDLKIFETLAKDPVAGPYPYQHLFEYLNQRTGLPAEQRNAVDLEELIQEVQKHPDQPRNLYLLAEAYLKLGKFREAIDAIDRLDRLSGGDARTAIGAGVLLARFQRYPEAIRHFQAAIAADPASDDAKYNLANTYFQVRDYDRTDQVLQQISPDGQKDSSVVALLADVNARLGRLPEAIKGYGQLVQTNPDNDQAYLALSLAHLQSGAVRTAEKILRQGLLRVPDSGRLYWGLGVVSAVAGEPAQAESNFKRAADLAPDWQSCYSALGVFYYETGQIAAARMTLERYARLFPHGGLNVGLLQQTLGQAEKPDSGISGPRSLSSEARQRFLQLALALASQS